MDTYYDGRTDTMQSARTHAHADGRDDTHELAREQLPMPDDEQSAWADDALLASTEERA